MVNGPPCAVCGTTLRWIAEQRGWWCDRCQTMIAAQQPTTSAADSSQPMSPYAPGGAGYSPYVPQAAASGDSSGVPNPYAGPREASQPYSPVPLNRAPAAPPLPPKRSKKGLVVGLAIAAAAIVAIVIVVVVATGGSGPSQRDALAAQAFAALADEKQLTALIDAEKVIDKFLDCSPTAKFDDEDDELAKLDRDLDDKDGPPRGERSRKRHLERTEEAIERAVQMAKGAKIEVVEVLSKHPGPFVKPPKADKADADDKDDKDDTDKDDTDKDDDKADKKSDKPKDEPGVMRQSAGKRVMSGCAAKVDHTIQMVRVKIRVTPEGKSAYDDRTTLFMIFVEGDRWYLVEPPRVYTGDSEIVAKARTYRDRMCDCKDMDCVDAVEDDFDKWRDKAKTSDLPDDEDAGFDSVRDEYRNCKSLVEDANKGENNKRAIAQWTAMRDEMCACKDNDCAERVRKNQKYPDYDYDDEQVRKQISKLRDEFSDCSVNAILGKSYAPPDPDMRIEPDIAPACEDYARSMQKLVACSKYPSGAKADLRESFKTMMALWKGYSTMRPELQRATVDTCISGQRSTRESMTKYGCH